MDDRPQNHFVPYSSHLHSEANPGLELPNSGVVRRLQWSGVDVDASRLPRPIEILTRRVELVTQIVESATLSVSIASEEPAWTVKNRAVGR